MDKSINILDQDYSLWLQELSKRYRQSQIKASIKVNDEMLRFYWSLGRDIVAMKAESRWGSKFFKNLSRDLKEANPKATCFSVGNLKYMKNFFCMYQPYFEFGQQLADQFQNNKNIQQVAGTNPKNEFGQQLADQIWKDIISIPWGHHMLLIDKFLSNPEKALFYVRQTVANGWSRNMLLNFIGTGLYERQGKALTNFKQTLPSEDSDLAQELTKDPYNFGFTGITKSYNERILKDALLNNITTFLTELGTGFAYVGKEYRLKIGEKENFIDLLFYNLNLSVTTQHPYGHE
ncbi:PDDEXK nuclease domain-containing protein [uncultured Prevotella sp.]|uniref:PDDEXK nuclease domain-containing protein n=1 Tax=uncultured Prevotella sp. TaxID=159272 RepID=UPI002609934D|nr:PDDEXK nuclease domain-containing protein [uncultured Prevotella sp.]